MVVTLLLVSCQGGSVDDARVRALEREVAQLKLAVKLLQAGARAPADQTDSGTPIRAVDAQKTTVTFTFEVQPESAVITVDGNRVTDGQWRGPRADQLKSVRVTRTGFRTVSQGVSASKDQHLVYHLIPGRGLSGLPAR